MAETNEFYIKIGADVDDAMNKLNRLSSQLSQLASNTQRSSNQIGGSMSDASKIISSAFSSIGVALTTAGITASIIGIGKSALTTAAELEQIAVSFRVFTGSAETANAMLLKLKEQALSSPMQFQDITKGAQILLQYGLNAQQVIPITKTLGDISGGNADKFSRLSLAFGQVNAAGRLMGQEARQMINAGFNPLKAISDSTGVSMATLTQKMHDGQISVQDVAMAFLSATSEGGQFFGMADEQSRTLGGLFNKLSESITFAMADIGNSLKNGLDLTSVITMMSNSLNVLKESFSSLNIQGNYSGIWASSLKGLIVTLTIAFDLLGKALMIVKLGFEEIFGTLGKRFGQLISYTSNKIFESLKNAPGISGVAVGINDYFKNIIDKVSNTNTNVKKSKDELQKLRDEYEKILKTFSKDPSKPESKTKAKPKYETISFPDFITKDVGSTIKRFIQENKDAATTISYWWSTSETKRLAELKKNYDKDVAFANKYGLDLIDIEKKYNSERELITKGFTDNKVAAREKARTKVIEQSNRDFTDSITKQKGTFAQVINEFVHNDNLNKISTYTTSMATALQDFGVNVFTGFASIAGSALAGVSTFGDAIAQVGSMFLSLIGDLLIQMGTSAIKLGISADSIEKILLAIGLPGGGLAAIAVGTLAVAAGTALKGLASKTDSAISANKPNSNVSTQSSTSKAMTSGSSYQYGGSSYSNQTIRLAIDLTGAITATQSGYAINKSLETTLRVTGR